MQMQVEGTMISPELKAMTSVCQHSEKNSKILPLHQLTW